MEMTLGLNVIMNQVTTEKPGFEYFERFMTRALTLRLQNTYIYIFRAFFGFFNF